MDVAAGGDAEPALNHRGQVREDVSEHVARDHDVVLRRIADDVHARGVDVLVVTRDVGVLGADLGERARPQVHRADRVGLVDERELLRATAPAREIEGVSG